MLDLATICSRPAIILLVSELFRSETNLSTLRQEVRRIITYVPAPKALVLVSFLIAEKVLVMTATNRLMSQKLRTMTHIMKNKHDMKNSESIIEYIRGDH